MSWNWRQQFGGRRWQLTPEGVLVEGEPKPRRTRGAPRTMRLYLACWQDELLAAAHDTGVPVSLLLMTAATENGPARVQDNQPHVIPVRREPGFVTDQETPHRISVGPCHLLISTARSAMRDPTIGRAWLQNVGNNLRACAAYIRSQRDDTGFDPILVAAAYNAGALRKAIPGESRYGNPWHLRTYGSHLDRAAAWYGDATAVLQEAGALAELDDRGLGRVQP